MFFKNKKKSKNLQQIANKLYYSIVEQARLPEFYRELDIDDNIETRFAMIILHMFIVMQKLKISENDDSSELSQLLFDTMFKDIELSLREQGIGDMGIPRRMKKMINQFYSNVISYENAVQNNEIENALQEIIYKKETPKIKLMAKYVEKQIKNINKQSSNDLIIGAVFWSPP